MFLLAHLLDYRVSPTHRGVTHVRQGGECHPASSPRNPKPSSPPSLILAMGVFLPHPCFPSPCKSPRGSPFEAKKNWKKIKRKNHSFCLWLFTLKVLPAGAMKVIEKHTSRGVVWHNLASSFSGAVVVVRLLTTAVCFYYGDLDRWRRAREEKRRSGGASHNLIISRKEKNEEWESRVKLI